jgi:putative ABC transport system permease protein
MSSELQIIPAINLALAFIPVMAVLFILYKWSLDAKNSIYSVLRMLVMMVSASSWIALGTIKAHRLPLFRHAFVSIITGGGLTLALVTQGVISLAPWFQPQYMMG